jgi:hypothetical protein
MWDVFLSFRFRVSVAASQKNPDFGTPKMEKALFVGQNENRPLWRPLSYQGPRVCPYGLVRTNYAMVMADSSSFHPKVMQPRTWYVIFVKGLSGKLLFSWFEFLSCI